MGGPKGDPRSKSLLKQKPVRDFVRERSDTEALDRAKKMKEKTKDAGGGLIGNNKSAMKSQMNDYMITRRGLDPQHLKAMEERSNTRDNSQNRINTFFKGMYNRLLK